jgi:hypothetical protein
MLTIMPPRGSRTGAPKWEPRMEKRATPDVRASERWLGRVSAGLTH